MIRSKAFEKTCTWHYEFTDLFIAFQQKTNPFLPFYLLKHNHNNSYEGNSSNVQMEQNVESVSMYCRRLFL